MLRLLPEFYHCNFCLAGSLDFISPVLLKRKVTRVTNSESDFTCDFSDDFCLAL